MLGLLAVNFTRRVLGFTFLFNKKLIQFYKTTRITNFVKQSLLTINLFSINTTKSIIKTKYAYKNIF